jgi:hypothetical protein
VIRCLKKVQKRHHARAIKGQGKVQETLMESDSMLTDSSKKILKIGLEEPSKGNGQGKFQETPLEGDSNGKARLEKA